MSIARTMLRVTGLLVAVLILAALAGCGGGSGSDTVVPPTDPPSITIARVELPDGFSFMGGNVTLKAVVVADAGVASVKANVVGPSSSGDVDLKFLAGGYYSTTYKTQPNTSSVGAPLEYTAVFTVTDKSGRTASSDVIGFAVPAPPGPPPPP